MSLRTFCLRIFQHCPLLASFSVENHTKAFEEFLQYKTRVPVRGAILLNQAMDSVVLVKGWKKGASWSFPRGKINKDEDDLDCAIREVYEETGFDLRLAGLAPTEKQHKYIEISMREQQLRLYVFRDVPMETDFQPRTRKEISKIQWWKLSELPTFRKKGIPGHDDVMTGPNTKFYMVAPFLVPLKKWIASQRRADERKAARGDQPLLHSSFVQEEALSTEEDSWVQQPNDATAQIPAIETLDGATRELQRLLKMQPPTQGLQPSPSCRDKGSALLSILKAGGSRPQVLGLAPQTPLDLTVSEPPQPRNPHHHSNQYITAPTVNSQEPPPVFELASNKATSARQAVPWEAGPQLASRKAPEALNSSQSEAHGAGLLQKGLPVMPGQRELGQGGEWASQKTDRGPYKESIFELDRGQASSSEKGSGSFSGPAKLNGQAMALLNAFRRDVTPSHPQGQSEKSVSSQQGAGNGRVVAETSCGGGFAQQEGLDWPEQEARPARQRQRSTGSRMANTAMDMASARHQAALLQMFKKPGSRESTIGTEMEQESSDRASRLPEASREQKRELLSLFGKPRNSLSRTDEEQGQRPPPGRVSSTSSRRGAGTPISPADQSFLLEYLQTVTNDATR